MDTKYQEMPIPDKRVVCIVCRKRLHTPNICTSAGVMILACDKHVETADKIVRLAQVGAFNSVLLELSERKIAQVKA